MVPTGSDMVTRATSGFSGFDQWEKIASQLDVYFEFSIQLNLINY